MEELLRAFWKAVGNLVHAYLLVRSDLELEEDQLEELHDVAQQLLRDPLARAVDRELHVGARVKHGCCEHGHRYRLPEPPWGADENLLLSVGHVSLRRSCVAAALRLWDLWCRVPAVELQQPRVRPREGSGAVALEEDARAALEVLFVEHALVEGAVPPPPIERLHAAASISPPSAASPKANVENLLSEGAIARHG